MEDFDTEELEEYRLWGIDPGITSTFVAADGCGSERHEYRAFSQSEFYTLAGRGGRSMRLPTAVIAKRKWKPRPVQQDARMPLFGFGDGQFSQSLRGQPAGGKRFTLMTLHRFREWRRDQNAARNIFHIADTLSRTKSIPIVYQRQQQQQRQQLQDESHDVGIRGLSPARL
ncbi:hypothetical protein DFQ29_004698 [Apophysomyces sp. BC1021]|nr:hypothetical protein DFQ29_004698 [Apophysomyces sp. BC1021]